MTRPASLLLLALAACTRSSPPAASTDAAPPSDAVHAAPPVTAEATTVAHTLPSGVTFAAAAGWTFTERPDGATLNGPNGELSMELIEVRGAEGLQDAIDQALAARVPDFDLDQRPGEDRPGQDGWETTRGVGYISAPEAARSVSSGCVKKDDLFLVMHMNNPDAAAQRRGSEMWLVMSSVRPPGHVEESYADRTPRAIDEAFVDEVRTSMQTLMEQADIPGAALTLFDADTVYLEEGFGIRKVGEEGKVTPETRFLIASNTKPLTTLLLAKLVDDGRITYDTLVTDIDPDFALGDQETTARVQVKHLICACTGMPRQDFEWIFQWNGVTPEEMYAGLGAMQPTTAFGELYQYSNPLAAGAGFVAGRLVHPDLDVGSAYDQAMQEQVFDPLGMTQSTFDYDAVLMGDLAWPHSWSTKLENVPGEFDLNRAIWPLRPAGALWSTVGDYRRYLQMELNEGALADGSTYIGAEALLARRAPQVRIAENNHYGMGLGISTHKGITRFNHGGSMLGYKSQFVIDPASGVGAVVFTNSDTGGRAGAILDHIIEMLYADDTPEALQGIEAGMAQLRSTWSAEVERWSEPPDPAAVERLAESYESDGLGALSVKRDGDQLVFVFDSWSSPMATRTEPDGSVSFMTTQPGIDGLELNAPADGPIEALTLRDMQHTYTFTQVD